MQAVLKLMVIFSQGEAEKAEAMMARDYSFGSVLLNLINAVHTGSAANLPCVVIKINLTLPLILISNLFTCIYIYIKIYML